MEEKFYFYKALTTAVTDVVFTQGHTVEAVSGGDGDERAQTAAARAGAGAW